MRVPGSLAPYLALWTTVSAYYEQREESAGACEKAGVHTINQERTAERATARALSGVPLTKARQLGRRAGDAAANAKPRPPPAEARPAGTGRAAEGPRLPLAVRHRRSSPT